MREELITKRNIEYFSTSSLQTLTGLTVERWDNAVIKELLDNALDALDRAGISDKTIKISSNDNSFFICDNAGGIPEQVIDNIYNFDIYTSSKRDYRTATRGAQGNALKTIIGICYLKGYELSFVSKEGRLISNKVNKTKLDAGILDIEKGISASSNDAGVYIDNIRIDAERLYDMVWAYSVCNPDVTFEINDQIISARTECLNKTEKTFIHWYTFEDFNALLQKKHSLDDSRTMKDFCQEFSGTQRIISKLNIDGKYLSDIASNSDVIFDLYGQLLSLTLEPKADILKASFIGEDVFLKAYGADGDYKYKKYFGTYRREGALIPYAIEGFLISKDGLPKATIALNNSMPYDRLPFQFNNGVDFCGKKYGGVYYTASLESILSERGFFDAMGVSLFVHVISPYFAYMEKSKTRIKADDFSDGLMNVLNYLCKDVIREVDRARREQKRFNNIRVFKKEKQESKTSLMTNHFLEGFNLAKGRFSTVAVRQIFYSIREIVNKTYDITLEKTDYSTFTQKIVTEMLERHPELEDKIYFDPRGFFSDPFTKNKTPMGTLDVNRLLNRYENTKDKIYDETERIYDLPVEMLYPHVLFIEKAGFNQLLSESGLITKLNLGIISTQGFSNRASKKLMEWFIAQGLDIYVLHDCDISGYLIADKLADGSQTFKRGLDVIDIGLNVVDVISLGKTPEVVESDNEYKDALSSLTKKEYDFFVEKDYNGVKYRRVELNALTNDEFIALIEKKIQPKKIEIDADSLEKYVDMNDIKDAIIHDAILKLSSNLYKKLYESFELDMNELSKEIGKNGKHWTHELDSALTKMKREKTDEIVSKLG